MARLQDQAEGGFIPTPRVVLSAIAQHLTFTPTAHGMYPYRLLDPVIGTGAVATLVTDLIAGTSQPLRWRRADGDRDTGWTYREARPPVEIYGVEIQSERAEQARACCCPKGLLVEDFFDTTIDDGAFSCVFANPPYGLEVKTTGPARRLELRFLQRVTAKLRGEGILIWIVPQEQLREEAEYLASWYTDLRCWRFSDEPWDDPEVSESVQGQPMYAAYHQVVVLARRRWSAVPPDAAAVAQFVSAADAGSALGVLPATCPPGQQLAIPGGYATTIDFAAHLFNPRHIATLASVAGSGVWGDATYRAQRQPGPTSMDVLYRPFLPPLVGQLASLATIGLLDGEELIGEDGTQILLKGDCTKRPVTVVEVEEDGTETTTITERFEMQLFLVDQTTGIWSQIQLGEEVVQLEGWPCEVVAWETFLANFGQALAEAVARKCPSRYTPGYLNWLPAICHTRPGIGVQNYFAEAIAQAIRGQRRTATDSGMRRFDRFLVIGEPGTTKTATAAKALYWASQEVHGGIPPREQRPEKQDFTPALVLCPENVVEQWQEELEATIPGVRVVILDAYRTAAEMTQFRRFDPECRQPHLTVMGCIDRVGILITRAITDWRAACQEAQRARQARPPKPCFVAILGFSAAKLGSAWTPRYQLRILRHTTLSEEADGVGSVRLIEKTQATRGADGRPLVVPCCPRCATPIAPLDQDQTDVPYLREDQIGCEVKRSCQRCHEPLWQMVPDVSTASLDWQAVPPPLSRDLRDEPSVPMPIPEYDVGAQRIIRYAPVVTAQDYRRYPAAEYLRWRWKGLFTTVIADEAHLLAAQSSAQGMATDALVVACGHHPTLIGMTGTLKDYASSMFSLLWRFNRHVRTRFPYGGPGLRRWLTDMGMQQKVEIRPPARQDGALTNRRETRRVMREIPGFSPAILLYEENAIFPKLAHIAPALPPLTEEVRRVPLGKVLGPAYRRFEAEATDALYRELAHHQNGGLASWFQGISIWPNLPWLAQRVQNRRVGTLLAVAEPLPADLIFPKEQVILELVREHLAQDRRVCILVENSSDAYDVPGRYAALLRADDARWQAEEPVTDTSTTAGPSRPPNHVLQVVELTSGKVATRKRQRWIREQIAAGCNVLICQSGLVHVGMNLDFPTILSTQTCYDTCRGRQAVRRSYRPWQRKPVTIIHLTYQGTAEERGMYLVAEKTRAAMMAEGDLPDAGLAAFGAESSNIKLALARAVYDSLHTDQQPVAGSLEELLAALGRAEIGQQQFIGASFLNTAMAMTPTAPAGQPAVADTAASVAEKLVALAPLARPAPAASAPRELPQRAWNDPYWITQLTQRKTASRTAGVSPAITASSRPVRHRPGDGHTCVYLPAPLAPDFTICSLCGDCTAAGLAPMVFSRSTYVALSCPDGVTWQVELVGDERQARAIVVSRTKRKIAEDPDGERRVRRLATLEIVSTAVAQQRHPQVVFAYRRHQAGLPTDPSVRQEEAR
ncbi:MAG: hypothetical protein H0X24_01200 [Ktedonobacterales bacterium]|nr:hypothetical protein [Ktedonobacterales bacterium]